MALKLLHTADWHLGLRFPAFDANDDTKLRRARLDVVDKILYVAEQHDVDAVLCAGDLFDEPKPPQIWWEGLLNLLLKRRWERPLFLLPGNHDPLVAGSPYERGHPFRDRLPPYVQVVDRDDFSFDLSDGAILHARPCRSAAGQNDLALALPEREPGDDRLRIGMVHGQTFDMTTCQTNFPIARDAGARRGFDYLAIGDTHGFRDVAADSLVPIIYPGAPEPTRFLEVDAGGVAIVFMTRSGRRPLIDRVEVANWRWREESVTDLPTLRALRDDPNLPQTVLRLRLEFAVNLEQMNEVEQILQELKGTAAAHGRAGVLEVDRDALRLDLSDERVDELIDGLPPILRRTADRLRAYQGTDQADVARRALVHLYQLARSEG